MKRIVFLGFWLVWAAAHGADFYKSVKVTFTGAPSDADKITVNGVDRTFKTAAATPATQVAIGATAADNATALYNQLAAYPLTGITPALNGTIVTLVGTINAAVTASMTGSWGSVAVTTISITQFPLVLPLSGETASRRVTMANYLVDALEGLATQSIGAGSTFLANFVNRTATQTITGDKSFSGANTHNNASQIWKSGTITNTSIKTLFLGYDSTHPNGIEFFSSTPARVSTIAPDANGVPSIYGTILSENPSTGLSYTPADENILTRGGADVRYARLASANAFTAANTFSALQSFTLAQGVLTNATGGFTNIYVTNLYAYGAVNLTNTAPTMIWYDTDAAADTKAYKFSGNSGIFRGTILSDDAGTESSWVQVYRSGATVTEVTFPNGATHTASLNNDGALYQTGAAGFGYVVGVGSTNITVPAGLGAGIVRTNGASASADPVNGVADWSNAGEWLYRTSASSEGAGQANHVHNRAAEVVGTGTDYSFSGTSYARVDFSGQDPEVTLPTAGTYLLSALVEVTNGGTANDAYSAKLYDATAAGDIANSEQTISFLPASTIGQIRLQSVATLSAGSHLIQVYAKNGTAARGSVSATLTKVSYVRLY